MYSLEFDDRAKIEFDRLGATVKRRFRKRLAERLENPRVESDALSGMPDCYKIKLRSAGYRMIYRVEDEVVVVFVIAVGKRDSRKRDVYDVAAQRLESP